MEKSVKQNTSTPVDADYSLEAVPDSARKGFWQMFFVMLGFTFFSASMSVGAKLGNGLDLSGFVWRFQDLCKAPCHVYRRSGSSEIP